MTNNNRARVIAALVALATTPLIALSQGNPPSMPVVEVVATKTPEAPHDVPASIEVITGNDLRARGASTLRDALALAAGVAIAPGGDAGPAGAVPEFWGLREFDAFLLVVDNVPWGGAFNPALTSLNLQDVERIEILRGPAPVTYGATSFVGVIHVVHKAAAEQAKYLQAYGGSYGSGGAAVDMPLQATMDGWKARLSAGYDKQGFADDRTSFTRGNAILRASGGTANDSRWLTANISLLEQDPASPHPRQGATLSTAVPLDANHNPAGAFINENRFAISGGVDRQVGNARWNTMASFTHASQKLFRGFLTSVSNSPNNASGFRENIDLNDLYVDSHLTWPAGSAVKWLLGADLLMSNGEAKGATFTYTAPLNGGPGTPVAEPANLNLDAGNDRTFSGAYSSMEWRPDMRFTLNAGLRLNATSEKVGEGNAVTNTRLSYSAGAMYSLWDRGPDHFRVFANYRDTFKPAAFDFGLGDDEDAPLKPETSTSYEAGVKLRTMEGRWDLEVSWFDMDFSNLVTSSIVNGQPSLQNIGKTRFKGLELATDVRLSGDITARATWSSHDGKFVDYVQQFDGTNTQLAGKRFEMSANQLYSIGATYAPASGFSANVGLNYTGDRYMNKRNTALAPAFTTYDAGIGYRMNRYEVRLDGRNLGDARDPVSESEIGDAQYYRMPARSFSLRLIAKY